MTKKVRITILILGFLAIAPPVFAAGNVLLDESFVDNRLPWPLENNQAAWTSIQKGKLFFAGRSPQQAYTIISYPQSLAGVSAFTIETSVSKIQGPDDAIFGLIWGAADINNDYLFAITGSGSFLAASLRQGVMMNPAQMEGPVNRGNGAVNVLKVVCRKNRVYHFINNFLVGSSEFSGPPANGIGFTADRTTYFSVDYLRVTRGASERDAGLCAEFDAGFSNIVGPPRYRLGVLISDMTPELMKSSGFTKQEGVYVSSVDVGSAAARSGIVTGDVILSVNGVRAYTANGTANVISLHPQVELKIWHDGKTRMVKTALTSASATSAQASVPAPAQAQAQLTVYSSLVEPQPVARGGTFDIKAEYVILDPAKKGQEVKLIFGYSILDGEKSLLDSYFVFTAREGQKTVTIRQGLRASKKPGRYQVRLNFQYGDKTTTTTVPLVVQ